ncbi:MAG: hypothetical protein ACODAJ_10045 [Planctomycetota bacterium]
MRASAWAIFAFVTLGALIGMVMGGLFGYAAGRVAPTFFTHLVMWAELEPVGTATVLGAAGGVVCGGGLAVFAVAVWALGRVVETWRLRKRPLGEAD